MASPTMHSTVSPETIKKAFKEIMDDEAQHVSFFQNALKRAGVTPRPKPTFRRLAQTELDDFITMSSMLENAGVGAFLMAMPAISDTNDRGASRGLCEFFARQASRRKRRV
jgi:hypothetical protein